MISKFKLFPNFNISQNFVQNVQKQKNTFVLSCLHCLCRGREIMDAEDTVYVKFLQMPCSSLSTDVTSQGRGFLFVFAHFERNFVIY